jgi:hypothetical protein
MAGLRGLDDVRLGADEEEAVCARLEVTLHSGAKA